MNSGKTVFAQLMKFLPTYEFRQCVRRYQGTYKVQTFSCLDQFLCMAFAQLAYRESLRDIEVCLRSSDGPATHQRRSVTIILIRSKGSFTLFSKIPSCNVVFTFLSHLTTFEVVIDKIKSHIGRQGMANNSY